jgi:DNA-binding Xre family transcriptional regulator
MMCRFLARKKHGLAPMTNEDIARASGLARSTVAKLTTMDRWDNVTLKTIIAYSAACGVNICSPWRSLRFWRRRKLAYLGRGTPNQRRMFARLLRDLHGNRRLAGG